ncbi:MAG: glycosyltransferase family 4 protein [Candidatus Omnitrophota bacterium]|jgi:glycosyltransferase involved in cell wall biosynthesis
MKKDSSKYKNIIVSTHDLVYPIMGGGGMRTLKVASEMKARGHNVVIIAPADKVADLDGIKVHWLHAPRKQRSQILSSLKFNLRLLRKFVRFAGAADTFFIHNTIAAATLPFLKRIYGFKIVLDITDIHAEYLLIGERNVFEKILTPFLLRYEYFIINSADYMTVATKAMKELLVSRGISADKIKVVYDGVDKERVPRGKEKGAEYGIIHLGAIDYQHGVDTLVRAIPIVANMVPQARFYFVGGGRQLLNIRKLAIEAGVLDKCIFTDYLPREDAVGFLKKAVIGIVPRKDSLPNRIITTLKIFEYWASGTAVISSELDGIKEIASGGRDVLWFSPGDIRGLAEKIILLLQEQAYRDGLIEGGFATVNRFGIQSSASQIADFALSQ